MNEKHASNTPEPWLRGTFAETPAVARAVIHALELAEEEVRRWAGEFSDEQLNSRPLGLPPVAFHLRHIARSLDRLLTYAEGRALTDQQIALLHSELQPEARHQAVIAELQAALSTSMSRVLALANQDMNEPREVGAKRLPASLGGLLVHVADHTQRHIGQLVTTAKVVAAWRDRG